MYNFHTPTQEYFRLSNSTNFILGIVYEPRARDNFGTGFDFENIVGKILILIPVLIPILQNSILSHHCYKPIQVIIALHQKNTNFKVAQNSYYKIWVSISRQYIFVREIVFFLFKVAMISFNFIYRAII